MDVGSGFESSSPASRRSTTPRRGDGAGAPRRPARALRRGARADRRGAERGGRRGRALRTRLAEDGVVSSLLMIHGLHPVPLETRVSAALDRVRPYMESHGGGVEVLSLEDDVLRLRLHGSCDGCPASASTLELAIKQELEEAAPDLLGIEVEGLVEQPRTFSGRRCRSSRTGTARLRPCRRDDARLRCSRGRRGDAATVNGTRLLIANVGGSSSRTATRARRAAPRSSTAPRRRHPDPPRAVSASRSRSRGVSSAAPSRCS